MSSMDEKVRESSAESHSESSDSEPAFVQFDLSGADPFEDPLETQSVGNTLVGSANADIAQMSEKQDPQAEAQAQAETPAEPQAEHEHGEKHEKIKQLEGTLQIPPAQTTDVAEAPESETKPTHGDRDKESDSDSEYEYESDQNEWQEMLTVAEHYNVYDEKGKLLTTPSTAQFPHHGAENEISSSDESGHEKSSLKKRMSRISRRKKKKPSKNSNKLPSSAGYTRIAIQRQAETYAEVDKKTDFLFLDEKLKTAKRRSVDSGAGGGAGGETADNSDTEEEVDMNDLESDDFDDTYQTQRTALDQMKATKEMLKDVEIIAYVGMVKLICMEMMTHMATLMTSKLKNSRRLSSAQASMAIWAQRVMANVYEHMDLSPEEQQMIEHLGTHGVEPQDLARSLVKVSRVDNVLLGGLQVVHTEGNGSDGLETGGTLEKSPEATETPEKDIETPEKDIETPEKDLKSPESTESPETDLNSSVAQEVDETAANTADAAENGPAEVAQLLSAQTIEINVAWTLVCDLFLVLIHNNIYDSRSRTLLMKFGDYLGLQSLEICQFEKRLTDALELDDGTDQTLDESEILRYRAKRAKRKRMVYIGLAGVGGSIILGVSGGLLGPLIGAGIAAGLSTVGIAGTSGFLAGTAGTAIVTTASTAIGAKVGATGMMRRTGNVKTFQFRPLHNNRRVNLIVTVSGWMNSVVDDIRLPFSTVDPVMGDFYSLLWEPEMLTTTGQTINILATEILTQSVQQILGATILTALMAAIQVPMALSKLGYLLDNPWNVSLDRAYSAGLILADTLIARNLGVRPVTLVGFSIGSRLIHTCLLELAKKGAYDLVENVILFGSPIVADVEQLTLCRSVVSGKFINGYSKKDWILGYLFRATSGGIRRVAGLSPIEDVPGIENIDCTAYVTGHMEYRKAMPKLLKLVGWNVLSEEFVEIDEPDPEQSERQRKLILEFDKNAQEMLKKDPAAQAPQKRGWKSWFKPQQKEWWEVYAEGNKEQSQGTQGSGKPSDGSENGSGDKDNEKDANSHNPADFEYKFDVEELRREVAEMKMTGELEQMNKELEEEVLEEMKQIQENAK